MGGVNSAREQDSSIGGGASNVCLGVIHMEEEVQDRVQVEVGREEQGEGETHGKGQSEEQRSKEQPLTVDDHEYGVMRTNTFLNLEPMWCDTSFSMRTAQEKNTCEVYLCKLTVG